MKDIKVLGIDLAKNIFQLHGTDKRGKCVLTKRLSRAKLKEFMVKLPPCLIGIEACGGAHYWAREFEGMGHKVKMMAPQFVKPYIKSNKNDKNDAKGIAEAVTRPEMKFVAIKNREQQDMLMLHRARQLAVRRKTSQSNQIRGFLLEYGIVIAKGFTAMKNLMEVLAANQGCLSPKAESLLKELYVQYKSYAAQVKSYDKQIEEATRKNEVCQKLMKIEGIGPLSASALLATIGDYRMFKNGRELSAYLGIVPRQYSSGNKTRLLGISKRGDKYLRTLLIHGARTVVKNCEHKKDKRSVWLSDKKKRGGYNVASVALANKNARIVWAMMASGEKYHGGEYRSSLDTRLKAA